MLPQQQRQVLFSVDVIAPPVIECGYQKFQSIAGLFHPG